jgi:hypothetical protein
MTKSYRFGEFVLDPGRRTLSRAHSPVSLPPKAFDVLLFLAQNPNRLITEEEMLQAVWGDTFVEEGNLAQCVWHLRKALGEEGQRLAREADERALALDPNLPQAHAQMGRIKRQLGLNWAGADASIQRAISLEPGNPSMYDQQLSWRPCSAASRKL